MQVKPLPQVFRRFLDYLKEQETEIWAQGPSASTYLEQLDAAVEEIVK
jgi:hypothetical protein